MERLRTYRAKLHTYVRNYWETGTTPWLLQLCGKSGMGKTMLASSYLEQFSGRYFSFRNLDAAFSPQIVLPGCKRWKDFFAELGAAKNRPVIFFDDVDDRNDKDEFWNALPALCGKAYVVLIVRERVELPFPSDTLQMTGVSVSMLLSENTALDSLDAMRRCFRTPETYNTLLYGLATGYNRISQLAESSGFPQNKCDKYLKALDKAGLLETAQKKDTAGHIRTHYDLNGGYWKIWFRHVFPSQGRYQKALEQNALQQLAKEIDRTVVADDFRKLCWNWLKTNYSRFYQDGFLAFDDPKQRDVTVNGVSFDYVQEIKDRTIYVKIWDHVREGFPKDAFQQMEAATTAIRPFYDNIYFVFSVGRACNYVEQLRSLGTVVVVDLKMILRQK